MIMPIESLICPCCTSAILYTLVQYRPETLARQMIWLGSGTLSLIVDQQVAQEHRGDTE
jgi:hypothetical protein